mgnify:FL=1
MEMLRLWLMAGSLVVPSAWAQEPVDLAAYRSYKEAYRSTDHESLVDLAERLSGSTDPWHGDLSLLARASYHFRTDDIKQCLADLDSLDGRIKIDHLLLKVLSFKVRALALKRVNAYDQAFTAAQRALALVKLTGRDREQADILTVRAEIERKLGRLDDALADLQLAGDLCEKASHHFGMANVLINLGNIHYSQKRYKEAWVMYRRCLDLTAQHGYDIIANNATMNLGAVAQVTGRNEEAIHLYDSLYGGLGTGSPKLRSDLMTNAGFALVKMDRHQEALVRFDTALAINARTGDMMTNAKLFQHRSSSLWALGRRGPAVAELERSRDLAAANGWSELEAEVQTKLYRWYKEMGRRDDALHAIERYSTLNDSLSEARFGDRIGRFEIQYETEKKERTIELQRSEMEQLELKQQRRSIQRNVLIGWPNNSASSPTRKWLRCCATRK